MPIDLQLADIQSSVADDRGPAEGDGGCFAGAPSCLAPGLDLYFNVLDRGLDALDESRRRTIGLQRNGVRDPLLQMALTTTG